MALFSSFSSHFSLRRNPNPLHTIPTPPNFVLLPMAKNQPPPPPPSDDIPNKPIPKPTTTPAFRSHFTRTPNPTLSLKPKEEIDPGDFGALLAVFPTRFAGAEIDRVFWDRVGEYKPLRAVWNYRVVTVGEDGKTRASSAVKRILKHGSAAVGLLTPLNLYAILGNDESNAIAMANEDEDSGGDIYNLMKLISSYEGAADKALKEAVIDSFSYKYGAIGMSSSLDRTYSVVFVSKEKMVVLADPKGTAALHVGETEDDGATVVSSALWGIPSTKNAKHIRTLDPGEMLIVDSDGTKKFI